MSSSIAALALEQNTKRRLLAGKPSVGVTAGLNSATSAAIIARAGVDHVMIDSQHGEWEERTRIEAIRSVTLQGVTPVVRVVSNTFANIGRALDAGALGIVVPMVSSVEEAQAAASAMRYPPRGHRSTADPLAVHLGSGYGAFADDEVFLAVQIETRAGLENVEAIMAVDGVDGCWLGPADLALTNGMTLGDEAHSAAIRRILAACKASGKFGGMFAANTAIARRWIEEGFQFVSVSGDTALIAMGSAAIMDGLADLQ